ncbi:MAG: T9SS type A sorting domain-containing protein [Flavobacterium sp.]
MRNITVIIGLFSFSIYSQTLHHQMISAQGTSKLLSDGTYISQTIGQQSIIGNYTKDGVTFGQGFQQSNWSKYLNSNTPKMISTVVYPNPFVSTINFKFLQPIMETISISVFDFQGRLVHSEDKKVTDLLLTLELPNLASSNYLIRLSSANYTYYSQILKQ